MRNSVFLFTLKNTWGWLFLFLFLQNCYSSKSPNEETSDDSEPSEAKVEVEWDRTLEGSAHENSIARTSDKSFVIAGSCESKESTEEEENEDYKVVKLDSNGTLQWEKEFGGSADDQAKSVVQTLDGGCAIAGFSRSKDGDLSGNNGDEDYWVVKLDDKGELQWEKNLGGSDYDKGYSLIQTSGGGFVVVGASESSDGDVGGNKGNNDWWIVKLTSNGKIQWERNLGKDKWDRAISITSAADSGLVIAGFTENSDNNFEVKIAKLGATGTLQWEKEYGGSGEEDVSSIARTSDGGFAVAGYTKSYDGDVGDNNGESDFWILKLDEKGALQWEKNLGSRKLDDARSIIKTPDHDLLVVGKILSSGGDVKTHKGGSDAWAAKLDSDSGKVRWIKNLGGRTADLANSVVQSHDGGFVIAGKHGIKKEGSYRTSWRVLKLAPQ